MTFTPPTYRWKLWYADGTTFSDKDGEPWESPVQGVVAVTQPGVVGKDILWNESHYLHHANGEWSAHDLLGLVDQTTSQINSLDCHRQGWDMPTRPFKDIVNRALREIRGE
jgi:hypothetical protein